jgi:hypothetical protein
MFTAVVHVYAAGFLDASLVFIVFVYVYVVIVNKHRSWLWITWKFVYGSRDCGIDNPLEQRLGVTRSLGKLLRRLVNLRVYQSFAHKVPGGLYKSCPEGDVDNFWGGWRKVLVPPLFRFLPDWAQNRPLTESDQCREIDLFAIPVVII